MGEITTAKLSKKTRDRLAELGSKGGDLREHHQSTNFVLHQKFSKAGEGMNHQRAFIESNNYSAALVDQASSPGNQGALGPRAEESRELEVNGSILAEYSKTLKSQGYIRLKRIAPVKVYVDEVSLGVTR